MSLTAYCHDIYGIDTLALWITQNKSRVYAYVCINKKFQEGTCFSLSEAQVFYGHVCNKAEILLRATLNSHKPKIHIVLHLILQL